jgi:hypothetical protein
MSPLCRQERHVYWIVQRKIQSRFRGNLDLLTLRQSLHRGSATASRRCSDGRALTAAGESTNECAKNRAAADYRCRALSARSAFFLDVASRHHVRLALIGEAIQRHCQFAGALVFSRRACIHQLQRSVRSLRDDDAIVGYYRRVNRSIKYLSGAARR